jgi:hypothetical protein
MTKSTQHKLLLLLGTIVLFAIVFYLLTKPRHEVPNTKVNLTWDIPGASSCEASGGWSGTKGGKGDATASIDEPTAFTLTCVGGGASQGQATLRWTPPTTNTDGTPLTDLAGYTLTQGASETTLDHPMTLAPNLTSYVVTGLPAGPRFFGLDAFNSSNQHSTVTKTSTTINASGTTQNFKSTVSVYVSQQSNPQSEITVAFKPPTVPVPPVAETRYLINLGGGDLTDTSGNPWKADICTNGTTAKVSGVDIQDTDNDALYLDYRYGVSASAPISCRFAIPTASHCLVNLLTSEEYFTKDSGRGGVGKRIFDMTLEGQTKLTGIDIFAEVGDHTALIKTAETDVTDGELNVLFIHRVENPTVGALRVSCLPLVKRIR